MGDMGISRASNCALHGLAYLASKGERQLIGLHEIAASLDIPQGYMAKIFHQLSRARLVVSHRGPAGGYMLAKPPDQITLLEVIEAMEGPMPGDGCDLSLGDCPRVALCRVRSELDNLKRQQVQLLKGTLLSSLL